MLLSHAHVDHNGCVGFLRPEIPVYTGLMTAMIGKCLQDPRPTGVDGKFCYLVPRCPNGDVLQATKGPRIQRRHLICESGPEIDRAIAELQSFWESVPGTRSELKPARLELVDPAAEGLRFWRVDHSIPGSGAFGMETPIGWVVYTGDLRMHGHSKWRTEKFAETAAALKPALLIVEGTRLDVEKPVTEPEVHQAADEVVAREPGLVIADFTARNIERLRTFRDIAKTRGRRLVVTTKDAYLLERLHVIDPNIPKPDDEGLAVLKEPLGQIQLWEREVHNRFASNLIDASAIRREPGGYILCLSYWDIGNLVDLDPDGGTYLYSSSEAYNEDQKIDQQRLENWLDNFGLKKVGGLPNAERGPYHASGHISGPALERLINWIAPERILPVHTEHQQWFERCWGEKIVVARYGEDVVVR